MASQTLLDIVQGILSEMVSDEVNSISDTNEAMTVATIVKRVYIDIANEMDLPGTRELIALDAYSNLAKPNYLKIPANVAQVLWLQYDVRTSVTGNKAYADIKRMDPTDFTRYVNTRPSTDTANYQVVQHSANVPLVINKKVAPTYWTSFDDDTIVFDNYNSALDATLQASKSLVYVEKGPDLVITDLTVPNLPDNLNSLLYSESLSRCMIDLNKEQNPKAERSESRMRVRAQRNKWRQGRAPDDEPNYGRR